MNVKVFLLLGLVLAITMATAMAVEGGTCIATSDTGLQNCICKCDCGARCPGHDWDYGSANGPANWGATWPACDSDDQSPIDIMYHSYMDFTLTAGMDATTGSVNYRLHNTGHALQIDVLENDAYTTTLTPQFPEQTFKLVQMHFHWGSSDSVGSEHTVQSTALPLELHMVHYNMDRFDSMAAAVGQPGGILVLGVLYEIGSLNTGLEKILTEISNVQYHGDSTPLTLFAPSELLPTNRTTVITYTGSFTTPPCTGNVTWAGYMSRATVSSEQMAVLRTSLSSDFAAHPIVSLVDNWRPTQPIGSRTVFVNEE